MPDLADILEFVDATGDVLAVRVPAEGPAVIRWGSQLIVREGQCALFLRDGRAMALFEPGRHVLTTQSVAGITGFVAGLAYDGASPFRAELVFVGRQLFRDLRWGTPEPVYLPDPVLLQIPVRANGRFAIRVSDPTVFVPRVLGRAPSSASATSRSSSGRSTSSRPSSTPSRRSASRSSSCRAIRESSGRARGRSSLPSSRRLASS
jgi:membrane protease subunit (stomatin/prohibitin family)